ncbi:nucleotidyltransferase domain-containing protein [Rhodothermus marinus]|uniref:nucleotidyltransferase domain-containing protein n=1 Tax=Rhodothermus marinus TaxID=29549 RepID=UPI0012BA470E|nr:nucleotidyltransferase domain-containing protein [Rhodothermus marinus]BBM70905.1 nucleotidyltransferase [Rhodothermus marinus]BBM73884.1 nucleotidyltransferase [Rhodothermus marinus]
MPSAVQKQSFGSVTVFSLDRRRVEAALQALVETLQHREEVLAVVCFGSWARGEAGVGSDIDVLVVLRDSDRPFLERIDRYRPETFPVDLDLFPYTLAEIRRGQPLARAALQTGTVLWARQPLSELLNDAP